MPQVLPLIVAWTQTSIVGWIFGAVVKMAAAYAISRALTPKPGKLGSMGNPITMSRDAAAARRVIYGQTRVSGPIIFAHVAGEKNSDLHLVIALAGHKLAEIGQILINDEIVDLDVDGNATTSKYVGKLRVRKWLGDQTTADALLVTESGGLWTSAHVCQGVACIYAKLVFDQEVFPQGIPNISAIVKGREVYDPRVDATAWTDNPALCALDYMRDTDVGFAAEDGEIDYASHAAAANVCDEAVTLAAGGTEKRYRCAGVFATDGEPASIIEQLVGTMSGTMVYSGGKFALKAGAYEIPTIEFDESHLRGPIQFQTDSSRRDVCNIVKGTYTSAPDLYQPRDFPQWVDAAAVTADAEEITRDLALDWVHSASQAQRLAAIEERASRLGGTIILQCNLSGLRVQVGDTITIKNTRFGWTAGEVFKVVQFKFSAGDGAVGVDLTCRRTASSVYAWASTSEAAVTPGAVPNGGPGIYTIPTAGDATPGTYDDLNGDVPDVPAGAVSIQSRGGPWQAYGFPPNPYHSAPVLPLYRRATISGGAVTVIKSPGDDVTLAHAGYSTVSDLGVTSAGITSQWTVEGGASGELTTIPRMANGPGSVAYQWYCFSTSPTVRTLKLRQQMSEWSEAGTLPSSADNGITSWNYGGVVDLSSSGATVETLSIPDGEAEASGRTFTAYPWAGPSAATAIRTAPTTVTCGICRELRVGTYVGDTFTALSGMTPDQRYRLAIALESRSVDETGTATSEWADAGLAVAPAWVADEDGEGGCAWVAITAPAGMEVRIASITAENF